jgi:REP element-mobilizing transposase RayT
MPDHVHLVITPLEDDDGTPVTMAAIMNGIKGASAHSVNKLLRRRGRVWQDESLDRILRTNESLRQKVEYVCQNPVRAGLISCEDEYPWLWREWVEGSV